MINYYTLYGYGRVIEYQNNAYKEEEHHLSNYKEQCQSPL